LAFLKYISKRDFTNYKNQTCKFKIGFVVPVHNQEGIILNVLNKIYLNTNLPLRLVIVLDYCTDGTENIVLTWIARIMKDSSRKINITLLSSDLNLQETLSDNLAFRILNEPEVLVDIQADILILEKNFDLKVLDIFKKHPDIAALSARGTESWPRNHKPQFPLLNSLKILSRNNRENNSVTLESANKRKKLVLTRENFFDSRNLPFGRFGNNIDSLPVYPTEKKYIWLNETVMRGPLAFRNSTLKDLGYLNSISHPLSYDDHEYFLRAWKEKNMRVAFYPLDYLSKLHWGSNRSSKTFRDKIFNLVCQWQAYRNSKSSALVRFNQELNTTYLKKEYRQI
jgi:hypothetical protein